MLRIIWTHPDNDPRTRLMPGDIALPPLPKLREIEFPAVPAVISSLPRRGGFLMDQGPGWLHERLILSITSTKLSIVTVNLERISGNLLEFGVDWDGVDKAFAVVGRKIRAADADSRLVVRFVAFTREMADQLQSVGEEAGWMERFQKVGTLEVVH